MQRCKKYIKINSRGLYALKAFLKLSGIARREFHGGFLSLPVYSFDGNDLKIMLQGAVDLLGESKGEIDSLNVLPVPDGNTGTNMFNSLRNAVREAESADTEKIGLMAAAAARGCLPGARGNSGVILSQFLSGFAGVLKDKETSTAQDITRALTEGAFFARQAVMNPVERTILTVGAGQYGSWNYRPGNAGIPGQRGQNRQSASLPEDCPEHPAHLHYKGRDYSSIRKSPWKNQIDRSPCPACFGENGSKAGYLFFYPQRRPCRS
ncbi:MAG TPA: hypothetical protein DCK76_10780 [Desulfotomaculum sp.]|nr:hypothetical protein [Desulfotomaculum sp.]HBY03200.1 hypothetical protein [Desulfotomaculum sp.]